MKKLTSTVIALIIISSATAAVAHSGGTDPYGCHVESATGIRHCH